MLLLLIAGGVAAVVILAGGDDKPTQPAPVTPAEAPTAPAKETAELVLEVDPPTAKLTVEGKPAEGKVTGLRSSASACRSWPRPRSSSVMTSTCSSTS